MRLARYCLDVGVFKMKVEDMEVGQCFDNSFLCSTGTVSGSVCSTVAPVLLQDLLSSLFWDLWLMNKVLQSTRWPSQVKGLSSFDQRFSGYLESGNVWFNSQLSSGPGLTFIAYPQATALIPLPQFWTVCFFVMFMLLAVDSHVITEITVYRSDKMSFSC